MKATKKWQVSRGTFKEMQALIWALLARGYVITGQVEADKVEGFHLRVTTQEDECTMSQVRGWADGWLAAHRPSFATIQPEVEAVTPARRESEQQVPRPCDELICDGCGAVRYLQADASDVNGGWDGQPCYIIGCHGGHYRGHGTAGWDAANRLDTANNLLREEIKRYEKAENRYCDLLGRLTIWDGTIEERLKRLVERHEELAAKHSNCLNVYSIAVADKQALTQEVDRLKQSLQGRPLYKALTECKGLAAAIEVEVNLALGWYDKTLGAATTEKEPHAVL